jgi:hypothetical protein
MPEWQITKPQVSHSNALQRLRPKSKAFEHSADLPINPLLEYNAKPRWRNLLHAFGAGALSVQHHPAK